MATILVIDDSMPSRRMASDALVQAGLDVVTAVNGKNGLDMHEQHNPDCIVVDLLMPVMTGQEFIRNLRTTSKTPVFVLSSDIQQSSRDECEALGINGFLNKPVQGTQLVTKVLESLSHNMEGSL